MLATAERDARELAELNAKAAEAAEPGKSVLATRNDDGVVEVRTLTDDEVAAVQAKKPVEKEVP